MPWVVQGSLKEKDGSAGLEAGAGAGTPLAHAPYLNCQYYSAARSLGLQCKIAMVGSSAGGQPLGELENNQQQYTRCPKREEAQQSHRWHLARTRREGR